MANKTKKNLPKGCRLCSKGAKAVYFITGVCDKSCYYCPISREKKGKNQEWINEKKISKKEELLQEIEKMNAKGVSITGGEPLLFPKKVKNKISFLKNHFSSDFHIHLYTSKAATRHGLAQLGEAGLDEIRFHPTNLILVPELVDSIKKSNNLIPKTGIEVPAIPGESNKIRKIIEKTKKFIDFVNLNEFEYSEGTYDEIKEKGFETKKSSMQAIKGSEKIAEEIKGEYGKIQIHFCSSKFKDAVQLRNRFIRRAKKVAKDYETISKDGTIIKGKILTNKPDSVIEKLNNNSVPKNLFSKKGETIETRWDIVKELKKEILPLSNEINIIEEHPTEDRLLIQKIPLRHDKED